MTVHKRPGLQDIPGPEPELGGWTENAMRFVSDPLPYMDQLQHRFGPVSMLVRGGNKSILFYDERCQATVFAFGPALNREILTQTDVFCSGPIIGPIYGRSPTTDARIAILTRVGTGLFGLNGTEHQRQRRLIQPAFHRHSLEGYSAAMSGAARSLAASFRPGQHLDFQREMFNHTLNVAGMTLFGMDFSGDARRVGDQIQRWLELIPSVSVVDTDVDEFLDLSVALDAFIRDLVGRARSGRLGRACVLSELVHAREADGDVLSEDELIGHINILLTAGHETTANVLSWTAFLLAQHPALMRELAEELASFTAADNTSSILTNDLLDRVIRESMRVFPPVTIGSRYTISEAQLAGYSLPAGTEVIFSHYHTHHDPALYPEPKRFWPERWLKFRPDPYQFLPFSTGTKMCIGSGFALMEIKLTLAALLARFEFEVADHAEINRRVWVPFRPDHMPLIVRERGQAAGPKAIRGSILDTIDLPQPVGC